MRAATLVLLSSAVALALVAPPRRVAGPPMPRGARASAPSSAEAPARAVYRCVGESTRFAVSGAVAATLLVRRDAETLCWVGGAIVAAVCNKILKKVIGEERPTGGDDGGMPSSHACSVCHLGVGAALRFPMAPALRAGLALYALTSLAWRVSARYHTAPQIAVGAAFGAATAFAFRAAGGGLEASLPATIPLPWILSIFAVGGLTVGSAERSKWLKRQLRLSAGFYGIGGKPE